MTIGDTTTTGPKKKKKSSVPPRRSELAYLLELGRSLDDAESRRSPSILTSSRPGVGRICSASTAASARMRKNTSYRG